MLEIGQEKEYTGFGIIFPSKKNQKDGRRRSQNGGML